MGKLTLAPEIQQKVAAIHGSQSIGSNKREERKEIWVSPTHWAQMGPEKQSVVVDIWHKERAYSSEFPFESMAKKGHSYTHEVGISFGPSDKLKNEAMVEEFRKLKIPHASLSYDEIEKKRRSFTKKSEPRTLDSQEAPGSDKTAEIDPKALQEAMINAGVPETQIQEFLKIAPTLSPAMLKHVMSDPMKMKRRVRGQVNSAAAVAAGGETSTGIIPDARADAGIPRSGVDSTGAPVNPAEGNPKPMATTQPAGDPAEAPAPTQVVPSPGLDGPGPEKVEVPAPEKTPAVAAAVAPNVAPPARPKNDLRDMKSFDRAYAAARSKGLTAFDFKDTAGKSRSYNTKMKGEGAEAYGRVMDRNRMRTANRKATSLTTASPSVSKSLTAVKPTLKPVSKPSFASAPPPASKGKLVGGGLSMSSPSVKPTLGTPKIPKKEPLA